MSLAEKISQRIFRPGPGVDGPVPAYGRERLWFILSNYYMRILGMNLLLVLFALPVVTFPAALCGVTRIYIKWIRDEQVYFWPDFWKEFKTAFFRRLLAWLLLMLIPVSVAMLPAMLGVKGGGSILWLLLMAVSFMVQCYMFPLMALMELPVLTALKNATILMVISWKRSLWMLGTSGLLYFLCLLFPLQSIPLCVLFLPALCQLMTTVYAYEVIDRRLILPQVSNEHSEV